MSKQVFFFATQEDMEPIINHIESVFKVVYFETGSFSSSQVPSYSSLLNIENIGFVSYGDWNHTKSYLVIPKTCNLNIRTVTQREGSVRYFVDQEANLQSIVIKPAGIFTDGILVAGKVATIQNDNFSTQFIKEFTKIIRKDFLKIGSFYVSPAANNKINLGWRLVTNHASSKEYDLIPK